jgi:hypothetical protein
VVQGQLIYSRLYRPPDAVALQAEADGHLAGFLEHGWQRAPE